ncbi:MAG: leucyl aminopeptidase [Alphaproteobacteria bacterium]|nr:leucyl aminopeptidase [Alphaproteobacteria bacterium]
MVEFTVGRNIRAKGDKLIISAKKNDIVRLLNEDEQILVSAIKKQNVSDKITEYNLGDYRVYVGMINSKQSPVLWQHLGGEIWKKIKSAREVKAQIIGATAENLYDFSLGIELASYSFDKYFTKKPSDFYSNLEKIVYTGSGLKDFSGYKPFASLANCVRYARDLINEPANAINPQVMSEDIKRLEYLGLQVDILDEVKMTELGFNLAMAVGQGSVNRPKIVVIKWKGNPEDAGFKVGLVGKGVTFDSGGISIKPAANMGDMKQDMAGAAVMTATMKSVALQNIKQNIVAVVGLVENMPSGASYRPGDVIKSMSGQTVEVNNTDAEGRLVLADCLTYIQKSFHPEYVIDMATLTGAIVIALGNTFAGLFANSAKLISELRAAGEYSGERVWEMPMDKEYDKQMDSTIADMKNTGGRAAGSATAACFLRRFIEKDTKWAHIDIAGMDLSDGSKTLYPKGASGFGVRLMNRFIQQINEDK